MFDPLQLDTCYERVNSDILTPDAVHLNCVGHLSAIFDSIIIPSSNCPKSWVLSHDFSSKCPFTRAKI